MSRSGSSTAEKGDACLAEAASHDALQPDVTTDENFVHPNSTAIQRVCPSLFLVPFYGKSVQYLGPKLPSVLAITNFMQRGIANNLVSYSQYAMFRERFGVSAERYQRLAGIASLGWSLMALTAVFTDTVALCRYTKRWYLVSSSLIGFAFALGFSLLPAKQSSANTGAAFLFLTVWSIANVIILAAAQYSRVLRKAPRAGPPLVGVVYSCIMLGGIISAGIQGPLSDHNIMQVGLYIAAAAQLVPAAFFGLNWFQEHINSVARKEDSDLNYKQELEEARRLDEERGLPPVGATKPSAAAADGEANRNGMVAALTDDIPEEEEEQLVGGAQPTDRYADHVHWRAPGIISLACGMVEINYRVVTDHWKIVLYCVIMTLGVVAMTVVTVLGGSYDLLYCSIAVSVVCLVLSFYSLPFAIAKANTYIFLQQLLYLQLPGVLDSFYMAEPACLPDGPHFSYTFYVTVAKIIGNVGGLLGVALFTYVFSKMSYRVTMIFATIVQIIASIFDLIMVKRWNIYIGIPDHAMYILGDQIVYQTCYYLTYMPIVLLLSRLLPRGTECMVMAVMSSLGNFGSALSNSIMSLIIELGWNIISEKTDGVWRCDFSNLPWLILVGHFACPLLILPLTVLLLPAARISDDIDIDGKVISKKVRDDIEADADGYHVNAGTNANEPMARS